MLRNVVGRGVDRRHPKRALVEVEVFAFLAQLVIALNAGNEDALIEACDFRELFKGVRLMNRASLNVNFKLLGGIGRQVIALGIIGREFRFPGAVPNAECCAIAESGGFFRFWRGALRSRAPAL